jgi:DNA-binding FrmR family transcriptional regulator
MIQKEYKSKILAQLNRAEGMLRKVITMVESDKYCIDVLQQSLAVIGFTKSANKLILENHLKCCFKEGIKTSNGKKQDELINELMKIMNKV